jgi:transmembrane sensor
MVSAQIRADAASPRVETLDGGDIDRALAWQTSRFNFDATPLPEVVRRLNHFSAGKKGASRLTISDGRLDTLLISGRVRADNIESFVEALEVSFGVSAERRSGGEIVLRQLER